MDRLQEYLEGIQHLLRSLPKEFKETDMSLGKVFHRMTVVLKSFSKKL